MRVYKKYYVPKNILDEIAVKYGRGQTLTALAKEYNASQSTLSRLLSAPTDQPFGLTGPTYDRIMNAYVDKQKIDLSPFAIDTSFEKLEPSYGPLLDNLKGLEPPVKIGLKLENLDDLNNLESQLLKDLGSGSVSKTGYA